MKTTQSKIETQEAGLNHAQQIDPESFAEAKNDTIEKYPDSEKMLNDKFDVVHATSLPQEGNGSVTDPKVNQFLS